MELFTKSAEETKSFGKKVAGELGYNIFALTGNLGSGKTTFVQGFADGLGIKTQISSPTFILVREYKGKKKLMHVDLYRLGGDFENEIRNLGLDEAWKDSNNIVVIEWADKIAGIIPKEAVWIDFKSVGESRRKITIKKP